jgi:outer membrane lipoprotein LolB
VNAHAPRPVLKWLGRLLMISLVALLASACSLIPPASTPPTPAPDLWEGRLSLRVDTTPPTVTQADVSLQGSAERGLLTLYGPLGTTYGELRWGPGVAIWKQGNEERRFASLDKLLQQTLGTSLPVPTLFAWINGESVTLEGWDLVSLPAADQPLLVAKRLTPAPAVDLRLRLTR